MDDELEIPQSKKDPPHQTWPPVWASTLLANTLLTPLKTPEPCRSSPTTYDEAPGTSCYHPSLTFRHQQQAYGEKEQREQGSSASWPSTPPPSLSCANSTFQRKTCGLGWRQQQSHSWPRCRPQEQTLRLLSVCPSSKGDWCDSYEQQTCLWTRTGGLLPFQEKYCTQQSRPGSVVAEQGEEITREAVHQEAEAEDVQRKTQVTTSTRDHDPRHRRVATDGYGPDGPGLARERFSNSFSATTVPFPPKNSSIDERAPDVHRQSHQGTTRNWCYRKNRVGTDLRVTSPSHSQEEWKAKNGFESPPAESTCTGSKVSLRTCVTLVRISSRGTAGLSIIYANCSAHASNCEVLGVQQAQMHLLKTALSTLDSALLTSTLEELDYSCGSPLLPESHSLSGTAFGRLALGCSNPIELAYYSCKHSYHGICCYCTNPDASRPQAFLEKYFTVLFICQVCSATKLTSLECRKQVQRGRLHLLSKMQWLCACLSVCVYLEHTWLLHYECLCRTVCATSVVLSLSTGSLMPIGVKGQCL